MIFRSLFVQWRCRCLENCNLPRLHDKLIGASLIDRLCSKIQNRTNNLKSPQVTISKIKEKDGSLRISQLDADEYTKGLIDMAQDYSSCVCELCGCPGSKKKLLLGWIKTLC